MARKEYELIDELKDAKDSTPIIRAGDMQRGSGFASWPHVFFYMFLYAPLGLMSFGLIIYKVFFAMSSQSLWLNIPFYIACVYMFWILLRLSIYVYVQGSSKTDQQYEWRPHGSHLMWHTKGYGEEEGRVTFSCSHCRQGKHTFIISARREIIGHITYIPAFFDPLFATSIEYNRTVSVPVSCPITARAFLGEFNVRQTSHNPITEVRIVGPAD